MSKSASRKQLDLITKIFNELAEHPLPAVEEILAPFESLLVKALAGQEIPSRSASLAIDALIEAKRVAGQALLTDQVRAQREAWVEALIKEGSSFATSLVQQYRSKGDLSPRQWECAQRIADEQAARSQPAPAESDAPARSQVTEVGVYFHEDEYWKVFEYWKVVRSQQGRLYAKRYSDAAGSWVYEPKGLSKLSADEKITAEQAAAFGHLHGSCVFCARDLTDERSIAVGYGPTCAENHGLPWGTATLPTPAQAVANEEVGF